MHYKNVFVFKTLTIKCLPKSLVSALHSAHCQLVCSFKHLLTTKMSVVMQWVISSLSLWVERQSRLVELNDELLPSGSTTADLHFQATHSHQSGYCKLYLLCRNLHRPCQVSRNQGWDSSTFSHPWHIEFLRMCYQQQIPRRIHNSTSNYIHSSGHSQCTSTNATWQSLVYCICK